MAKYTILEKVGECCYRNPHSGTYIALVKLRGKQYKQSLRTQNLSEARRKLAEFRRDLEQVDPQRNRMTVDSLVEVSPAAARQPGHGLKIGRDTARDRQKNTRSLRETAGQPSRPAPVVFSKTTAARSSPQSRPCRGLYKG